MKLTKKQNPFVVKVGQVWKAKDKRRQIKFTVIEIKRYALMQSMDYETGTWMTNEGKFIYFAIAQYSGRDKHVTRTTRIDLLNFDRYVRVE
jgi:hypothetical protein